MKRFSLQDFGLRVFTGVWFTLFGLLACLCLDYRISDFLSGESNLDTLIASFCVGFIFAHWIKNIPKDRYGLALFRGGVIAACAVYGLFVYHGLVQFFLGQLKEVDLIGIFFAPLGLFFIPGVSAVILVIGAIAGLVLHIFFKVTINKSLVER